MSKSKGKQTTKQVMISPITANRLNAPVISPIIASSLNAKLPPTKARLAKEERQEKDLLYKELISTYLDQLVETVSPTPAGLLDFSKAISQNKELYIYRKKAIHGQKKTVDHLFEVPFLESTETAKILIHIELKNNDSLEMMQKRMLHYFHLKDDHRKSLLLDDIDSFLNLKPSQKQSFYQKAKSTKGVNQILERWSQIIAKEHFSLGENEGILKGQ